ncbi:hypothetical protein BD413DRAFT_140944 [Trametes elegans]|nr:hypothetical protein BD413DRAFT_140944 [Trametes elegans]
MQTRLCTELFERLHHTPVPPLSPIPSATTPASSMSPRSPRAPSSCRYADDAKPTYRTHTGRSPAPALSTGNSNPSSRGETSYRTAPGSAAPATQPIPSDMVNLLRVIADTARELLQAESRGTAPRLPSSNIPISTPSSQVLCPSPHYISDHGSQRPLQSADVYGAPSCSPHVSPRIAYADEPAAPPGLPPPHAPPTRVSGSYADSQRSLSTRFSSDRADSGAPSSPLRLSTPPSVLGYESTPASSPSGDGTVRDFVDEYAGGHGEQGIATEADDAYGEQELAADEPEGHGEQELAAEEPEAHGEQELAAEEAGAYEEEEQEGIPSTEVPRPENDAAPAGMDRFLEAINLLREQLFQRSEEIQAQPPSRRGTLLDERDLLLRERDLLLREREVLLRERELHIRQRELDVVPQPKGCWRSCMSFLTTLEEVREGLQLVSTILNSAEFDRPGRSE